MTVWDDLRCPECGGQTYGVVGNTFCESGHAGVSMIPATKADWCGHPAPEKAAAKGVQPCARPPGHRDGHAWWLFQVLADGRHSALWYFGEDGKAIVHADLKGMQGMGQDEAAAFLQVLEFTASKRAAAAAAHAASEADIAAGRTHKPPASE